MENEDSVKEEELIKQENYLDYIEEEFLEYGSEHMEGVPELTTDEEEAELNEGGDDKSKIVHMISPKSRKKMMKEILSMEEIISFNCSHCSKTFGM